MSDGRRHDAHGCTTPVLPELMASGRTRSANVPREFLPCGSIDPDNPVIGPMGEERPFDPHASAATRMRNRWLAIFDRSVGQEKPEAREH